MLLYLMRHGVAESNLRGDHHRGLTAQGRGQTERLVDALVSGGWRPGAVICSPLLRARQTAEIVAARLPGVEIIELAEVIDADDALLELLARLGCEDPLVVGHQPGLPLLASNLMEASGWLSFPESAVACVELNGLPPRGPGQLRFLIYPGLLG